jgi:aspartate aminotransferase-like enzyme
MADTVSKSGEPMFKERLLTPGPTTIPLAVLQAMNVPMLHHRSEVFKRELKKACEGMRWLLSWDSDPIFLACSGTGAMEAAILNTCRPGDSIIAVNGGAFGGRWAKIAQRLGVTAHEICVEWGSAVRPEQVREALAAHPDARAFCVQHSETSTTVLHPLEDVLKVVKDACPSMLTIVDGISSCATTPMPGDPATLDIYIAGSQKALMLPPGLAVMALSAHAWATVEATPKRTLYFDLSLERKALAGGETSWTPAATIILGLNAALELFRDEGLESIYARHSMLSRMTVAGLTHLGCRIMAPEAPCPSVTGFFPPEGVDADKLRTQVRTDYGIRLAGGQGPFKGRVVRVGHMGYVDAFDVVAAVSAIGLTLRNLGADADCSGAVTAALSEVSK